MENNAHPIVVSASRRTDLPSFFVDYLARSMEAGQAEVKGHYGRTYVVDLDPDRVHTLVFWSKNYVNFLRPGARIRTLLSRYRQLFFHYSITGLGRSLVERSSLPTEQALEQIPGLVALAGSPQRVTIRFDPIVFWRESGTLHSNWQLLERVASSAARHGVTRVVTSFTQWYGKSVRRANRYAFEYVDPPAEEKASLAREMCARAASHGCTLAICSQADLAAASGVPAARCIDGDLLSRLHPDRLPADLRKDSGQRADCGCTRSRDIGSYSQACSNRCVYCYATPAM